MKTEDIKNVALALKAMREGAMKPEVKKALAKASASTEKGKKAVTLPKAPFKMDELTIADVVKATAMAKKRQAKERQTTGKSSVSSTDLAARMPRKEAMDAVDKSELKGKHKDRKDKDIDNDGDVDSSDKFLHKRRKAVGKAMASKKKPSVEKDVDVEVQEAALEEAPKMPARRFGKKGAPKMTGDSVAIQRAKDAAHNAAMGRTKTGRKKPVRTMTSTQKSLASMRREAVEPLDEVQEASLKEGILNKSTYNKKAAWSKAYAELKKMKKNVPANKMRNYNNLLNRFFHTIDDFEPSMLDKWNTKTTSNERDLGDDQVADLRFELKDIFGKDGNKIMEMKNHGNVNNGSDAEQGLSPNAKKMMAMKTDGPEGTDITKVAPKTFAAMRASGKKAAMRNNDNAKGESKIKPSATEAK